MVRFGPERTGYTPFEFALSPANVGRLTQQWTASLIGSGSDPVVADGHVYVTATTPATSSTPASTPLGYLYAFDSSGRTNCGGSPSTCSPVWSAPYLSYSDTGFQTLEFDQFLSAPTVANGTVYIERLGTDLISEFGGGGSTDAYNADNGTKVFSEAGADIGNLDLEGGTMAPAVSGGTLYGSFEFPSGRGGDYFGLDALDPSTGFVRFFAGLSTSPYSAPTVANGILYAASGNTLSAFDASGSNNCGPGPGVAASDTVCQPLWTATTSAPIIGSLQPTTGNPPLTSGGSYVAVANGYVYVGDASGTLSAFPAGGCGAATCAPVWTAQTSGAINSSAAVTPTTVFVGSDDGKLYAFPARGCGAATCQPLWQAQTGGAVKSSSSVAGDVVYVGSDDDNLYAFNASGCGAATCTPLLQTNVGAPVETSPAIANGHVYVTDTAGTLHAYGLPAAPSS
jgi:hypothetical protein